MPLLLSARQPCHARCAVYYALGGAGERGYGGGERQGGGEAWGWEGMGGGEAWGGRGGYAKAAVGFQSNEVMPRFVNTVYREYFHSQGQTGRGCGGSEKERQGEKERGLSGRERELSLNTHLTLPTRR